MIKSKFILKATVAAAVLCLSLSTVTNTYAIHSKGITVKKELKETNVYIVGDSTACIYGFDDSYAVPRAGWGMYLQDYLDDSAKVIDLALAGRSSKSFTTEDEYNELLENLKEGDFLIIQFGHNDAKNKNEEDIATRYTDPSGDINTESSFKYSLYNNYIKIAKDKGAVPILITPVSRRNFDDNNKIKDTHGLYDDAVRELADELDIECIDMTSITADLYNKMGAEGTRNMHAVYYDSEKGENGLDNTHFNHIGGKYIAEIVAEQLVNIPNDINKYVDETKLSNVMNEYVTRSEFIGMLLRLVGKNEKADSAFLDVNAETKNADYINLSKKLGISLGDGKGNFMPDKYLTYDEMNTFIYRLFGDEENDINKTTASNKNQYVTNAECLETLRFVFENYLSKNTSDVQENQTIEDLEKVENTK